MLIHNLSINFNLNPRIYTTIMKQNLEQFIKDTKKNSI